MIKNNINDQSQQTVLPHAQRLSLLAVLAIVGQVVLLASAWLLPIVSEYSLVGDNISELVLGRYGFVQTAAFLVAGIGTLGLAFAIRELTADSWGSFIGSLLIGIYGAGAILSAIFPTDPINSPAEVWSQSTTGMIHSFVALVSFVCAVVGMFVLTHWTFMRAARWRSLLPWLALFPAGAFSLIIGQTQGPLVGLLQRMLVTIISAWLILVALRARSIVASEETEISNSVQPR
ncbi:MAG: DUF998 domain-containing protein [Anaerolineae bacterium]|nr:DUF998 domain-containing protein [Anaerolineae bacterium]